MSTLIEDLKAALEEERAYRRNEIHKLWDELRQANEEATELRDENAKLRAEQVRSTERILKLIEAVADAEVLLAGRGLTDRATPEEKATLARFRNRGKAPTP